MRIVSENFNRVSYEFQQFHETESKILNAVKVLLNHGQSIKDQQVAEDMFERAINIRDFELANVIYTKHSIDINKKDAQGRTLLHRYLTDYSNFDKSFNFDKEFFGKRSSRDRSTKKSNKEQTILFLCKHGADVQAMNNSGQTPLEIAEKTDRYIFRLMKACTASRYYLNRVG